MSTRPGSVLTAVGRPASGRSRLEEVLAAGLARSRKPPVPASVDQDPNKWFSKFRPLNDQQGRLEEFLKLGTYEEVCDGVIEWCSRPDGSGECNELEWEAAAKAMNKLRMSRLAKSKKAMQKERNKAFTKLVNSGGEPIPDWWTPNPDPEPGSEEELRLEFEELVESYDFYLRSIEEEERRVLDPKVPGTSPTWKEEFKRQCFEMVEAEERGRKQDEYIAKEERERSKQLFKEDEAYKKRMSYFNDNYDKRQKGGR